MDNVCKPKHLYLIPSNLDYLQLNEDKEFEEYLNNWSSLDNDRFSSKMQVKTLEINFSHEAFLEGVLTLIEPTEELILREHFKVGRFNLEKFHQTSENLACKTLKLHMNTINSIDFYYFNLIPIHCKTIFSRMLEGAFSKE